jgi:hypothetical protein
VFPDHTGVALPGGKRWGCGVAGGLRALNSSLKEKTRRPKELLGFCLISVFHCSVQRLDDCCSWSIKVFIEAT